MAVEIPVVVDMEGAFEEAAKQTPKAAKPLVEQVDLVSKRISAAIQKMQKATAKPVEGANTEDLNQKMSKYANTVRLASQQMLKLGQAQGKLVAGRVDIQDVSTRLSALAAKWNSMKLGSKFDPDGKLRVKAQELITQMTNLTGKTIRFGNALNEVSAKATTASSKVAAKVRETNTELTAQSSIFAKLSRYVSGYMALFAGVRFIRNVREVTSEFELQRVALGSIIRDTERAESLFKQIKAAAVESPFEIKDLVSYTKQLSAYQIETEKLFDTTMKLADISAGLGVDMSRLILAFGQVRAAAVLRGQELRQFTEAGIPLVDKLAQKFSELNGRGVTTAEVFELISKRAVPFSMIEEIFNDMTSAGGMFYKMQEKQAETLLGQWNNLKDAVSIMYDEIGNTNVAHGAMEALIRDARLIMQNWRQVADILKVAGLQFAAMKLTSMFLPKLVADTKLAERAEAAYARAKRASNIANSTGNKIMALSSKSYRLYAYYAIQAARATTGWGRAINTVKGFLSGNWISIAVTAITLVAGKLYAAAQEAKRLNKELANIAAEGAIQVDRSVRSFERLAKTAVEAADGSKEQKEAVDELTRTYGDMLPSSDKVIDKLKEMEGNYTSLTDAIRQKINMQIREQQVDEITANYGKKIGAERDTIKKYLKAQGLSTEEISAVTGQLQAAVESGLISVGQGVEEQAKAIEEIIFEYTGRYIKLTKSMYSYIAGEGARQVYRGEQATSISKSFASLVKLYSNMNDAIKEVDEQMAGSVGVMGVYRAEWKKLQDDLGNFEGTGKTRFAKNESKIKNMVEQSIAFLQEKFNEAEIDISTAIVNGTPNFDLLESAVNEMKSGPTQASLRSIIADFKKQYQKIIPSDQITDAIKAKMIEVSESTGISMDRLSSYIKKAGEDSEKWLKELGDNIESYRKDAQRTRDLMTNFAPAATDENRKLVEEYDGMANALQIVYDALSRIIKLEERGGRSDRLQKLREEISDITNAYKKFVELTEYMSQKTALVNIDKFFPSLAGWAPTYDNMLQKLGDMLTKYSGDADATRLIEQAIANIKFDKIKSDMEGSLKRLSDEIKRSEAARDFYKNILNLTGDEELAATMAVSVYGTPGDDFKERMKRELTEALSSLDAESFASLDDTIRNAFDAGDYIYLMKNLEKVPEKLRDVVKNVASDTEKYNADIAKSYTKLLLKFDEVEQQRVNIEREADQNIETLREGLAQEIDGINKNAAIKDKQAAIDAAEARVQAVEQGIIREKNVQLFKLSRDYKLFFSTIGVMSKQAARATANAYKKMITEQFEQGEISLTKFRREWNEVEEQLRKYDEDKNPLVTYLTKGIDGLIGKIKEYGDSMNAIAGSIKDGEGYFDINKETMDYIDRLGKMFGGELFGVSGRKNVFAKMMAEYGPNPDDWEKALNQAGEKLSQIGSDFGVALGWADFWVNLAGGAIKGLDQIAQKSKNTLGEMKMGWNVFGDFMLNVMSFGAYGWSRGGMTPNYEDSWERLTALNEKAMSGFEKFKQGDIFGALLDNVLGWMEVFGKSTKAIDREIKNQSDLIDDLKYEYDRLGVAIDKSFGSDYISNYNQQLAVLEAQAEAYRKQAELERSKGKKADEETAKGYDKSARAVEDQIEDARGQLAEFMSGTDLTSAATDFANAWIEAYKQFGSTTDAMKEKFDEMIQNMVVNSLAAQLIQGILKPIFDQIDEASRDGALTAQEIGAISAMVPGAMEQINAGMTVLMNQLTSAGVNLRQQAGTFTGISRDIATASEESITGLAAGINTQNFYISHIDQNVALILSALTGGTTTPQGSVTGQVADPYKDEMLKHIQTYLPNMDQNLAELLRYVKSVIVIGSQNRVAIQ